MSALEIRTVMHPSPFTISPAQSLEAAKQRMAEHGIRHLPVQDGGKLVGVLSDRDLYFALAVDRKTADELTVRDACTAEPYIVPPSTPVYEVARRMAHEQLGCALVAENDHVVGIFTTVDAARLLGEMLLGELEQ